MMSEEVVNGVRETFSCSFKKSKNICNRDKVTAGKTLHKRFRCFSYQLHLVQKLHPQDNEMRLEFCSHSQEFIKNVLSLLSNVIFRYKANFHLS